jgi:hypothetical protein
MDDIPVSDPEPDGEEGRHTAAPPDPVRPRPPHHRAPVADSCAAPRKGTDGALVTGRVRHLSRRSVLKILGGLVAIVFTLVGVHVGAWVLWPEIPSGIAVLIAAVLLAGLVLWWRSRAEPGATSNLGAALLGGTLVAVTIFAFQVSIETAAK